MNRKAKFRSRPPAGDGAAGGAMEALARRVLSLIPKEGEGPGVIPNLSFHRFDQPTKPNGYLMEPSICLVMQGMKHVILGERQYTYGADHFFVASVDLPVIARIVQAHPSAPYLGMVLRLDRMEIARLVMESPLPPMKTASAGGALEISGTTKPLLDAISRLIDLLDEPELIPTLAPLIQRELLCRLLLTPSGPKIRQIAVGGSPTHQISQVIDWIQKNLREKLRVEELASLAGMSVSTLHHHFRALTSFSPLQFQKRLRLNEAGWLMLKSRTDAATAAFSVGYESPSQFSREYSRLFGAPPLRDIRTFKASAPPPG